MISFFAIFTIVKFRIREFLYEYNYSILAPLISNLLFVIIFSTIDRYYSLSLDGITFIDFLVPGLIVMTVAQESFDNPSVSIINSKQIGSFDDFLFAPLSRIEIFISYIVSQIITGLSSGTYTCTVTDANGCINYDVTMVNEPNEININLSTNDISCFGLNDGNAFVNPNGGSGNGFGILWSIIDPLTGLLNTNLNVSNIVSKMV